jgi:hypothetical protein
MQQMLGQQQLLSSVLLQEDQARAQPSLVCPPLAPPLGGLQGLSADVSVSVITLPPSEAASAAQEEYARLDDVAIDHDKAKMGNGVRGPAHTGGVAARAAEGAAAGEQGQAFCKAGEGGDAAGKAAARRRAPAKQAPPEQLHLQHRQMMQHLLDG